VDHPGNTVGEPEHAILGAGSDARAAAEAQERIDLRVLGDRLRGAAGARLLDLRLDGRRPTAVDTALPDPEAADQACQHATGDHPRRNIHPFSSTPDQAKTMPGGSRASQSGDKELSSVATSAQFPSGNRETL
jgi:hypothetical protein